MSDELVSFEQYTAEEERDSLIVFLTWLFPSSLEKNVLVIDTPVGIMNWRTNPSMITKLNHIPRNMNRMALLQTDREKYEALIQLGKRIGGIIVALGMYSGLGEEK